MKVTWETEDIYCGRIFGINGVKERGMIGYDPTVSHSYKYVLISLSDGMLICDPSSKTSIVDRLNDGKFIPIELLNKE